MNLFSWLRAHILYRQADAANAAAQRASNKGLRMVEELFKRRSDQRKVAGDPARPSSATYTEPHQSRITRMNLPNLIALIPIEL